MTKLLSPFVEGRTYRRLAYLLSAVPFAVLWFGLLLGGWLAAGLSSVTPLFVPVLLGLRAASSGAARLEAGLARRLLDVDVEAVRPSMGRPGYWGRIGGILGDPALWREQVFLVLRTLAGGACAIGAVSWIGGSIQLILTPALYRAEGGEDLIWHVDSLGRALPFLPVGLLGLLAAPWVVRGLAAPWRPLASGLLGGRSRAFTLRGLLVVHAGLYAGLNALFLVIWAATSPVRFWPQWSLVPLALPLAVHAWAVLVDARPAWQLRLGGRALAFELGLASALWLFLVAVWAMTTRATFWPEWASLGLAIPLLVHLTYVLATSRGRAPLAERIGVLETTRAGAVDVADADLRRIERDLHDGAQARLVALGMSIGLAEQRLAEDPEGARELLAEARVGAVAALQELRDLARGIHPPILADRGLAAALDALAAATPLPVSVDVDLPSRPPETVETAAYFVAAEALANAVKHGVPGRVEIRIRRAGDDVIVRVDDDGVGGADPAGRGLTGIRRRVEALDGALTVTSPPLGPTSIEAVLPCAP
jgi:signal transduction histidine kinase